MKVVIFETVSKVIIIGVMAYALGFGYENMWLINEIDRGWARGEFVLMDVKFSVWPSLISILLIILYLILSVKLKPRKRADFLLKSGEFQEADERELSITNKATRASYVTLTSAAILAMAIMYFSTRFIYEYPAFPIYLIAGSIMASSIAYAIALCKEFSK
ncbi:Ca2+/Na+ antiporter [Sporosarcina luteola]|nr:Ca2+/Na+ antiporter [Sporosarcina luteola]